MFGLFDRQFLQPVPGELEPAGSRAGLCERGCLTSHNRQIMPSDAVFSVARNYVEKVVPHWNTWGLSDLQISTLCLDLVSYFWFGHDFGREQNPIAVGSECELDIYNIHFQEDGTCFAAFVLYSKDPEPTKKRKHRVTMQITDILSKNVPSGLVTYKGNLSPKMIERWRRGFLCVGAPLSSHDLFLIAGVSQRAEE